MTATIEPDVTIDSRDAACPGPLMDLIGKVKTLEAGTVVELQTTERNSTTDVPEWLEEAGHDLLEIESRDDHWSLYIEVN
ncbi:sulfurtransferase TusA family protein [Natronorubrum aibiense]|uniref:Sulfurtransferase TusA family protein n=1 Tax=Natronorubrum aibiense TaxID=348826 RepID=A0A5P9P521_9EURY|nr:sulfurtransferase TusA family protein [Natronorubrum aibiense]QFU83166.1 sulfurtransferase TusA family protein [Natronorubrum aibiense]